MTLSPGVRLGPYEIVAPLGAGGMGEVYRARDTRLDRIVALKIVRTDRTTSDEGRRRFEREARTVSQISHPNVCALYDVGRESGREFLVMELVEGETLAARLIRGPLSIGDTIRIGQEMAHGLEAAHRRGVIHRDLKPGNVMLSKHGAKVLDFGLARALGGDHGAEASTIAVSTSGTILGTLPYMAPEQLEGRETDARTDVFALGAVLYEMVTGRRAFEAPSQAGVAAAILHRDPPPPSSERPDAPWLLDHIVLQCLTKDPDARQQSAGEVARTLALVAAEPVRRPLTAGRSWPERLIWIGIVAALVAVLAVSRRPSESPTPQPLVSFEVPAPAGGELAVVVDTETTVAFSPDGRHIAFPLRLGETRQIWLHSLETREARALRGTDGVRGLFWSPTSRHVAFFANGALKRVAIDGDVVETICSTTTTTAVGTWGSNDTILFADGGADALVRVPASGGTPEQVVSVKGRGIVWPHLLPDGRHFLLGTPGGILFGSLESAQLRRVLDAPSFSMYSPSGHVLYVRDAALVAQRFDVATGMVSGDPRVLAERIQYFAPTAGASFSSADTGAIVYRPSDIVPRRLVWLGRDGRDLGTVITPDAPWAFAPRLSPDGTRLAVSQQIPTSGSTDLWVYELPGGTPTRLTADVEVDNWPNWWPDGRSLVFSRNHVGDPPRIFRKGITDLGRPTLLVDQPGFHFHPAVAPDGSVVYVEAGDLFLWTPGASRSDRLAETPFWESSPAFSPDGRWLAYDSNASGRTEVYVQPFRREGERVRVSSGGGRAPRWRRDGREIFFLDLEGRLVTAVLTSSGTVAATEVLAGAATPILDFDVSPDGQRFVVILSDSHTRRPGLTVLVNWERLLD